MPVLHADATSTHQRDGATFTSLATPTRGSTDTSVWLVDLAPGTPATPHELTREEIFVVLSGTADVTLDGGRSSAGVGDVIVVPPAVRMELANNGPEPLRMLCCLPVGGQARLDDGTTFTPPWAE